jgi:hypothetical protein
VKANQFSVLCASALDSTLAKQTKVCPLVQSRCPTILIDDGLKSRIGAAAATAGCVGCAVGLGFGVGEGVAVGVGASVGLAACVRVGVGVTCPVAAAPQEANTLVIIIRQSITATLCIRILL